MWDASERNVIIHQGTISGIVDVDDICFGDPLLVIALTAIALETEGHDTLYTDYWAAGLQLDAEAQQRLDFYRLFYIIVFMRKQDMKTSNAKKVAFDSRRLQDMFNKLIMNY
ncbi:phosphotransferase [uncultured Legionella sp.]|uniref:phosphotransferase n=1 Tax=uncultured Legionella sp. TaxID=210934 RepID=UPI00262DC09A|nr:phosphotransferase [uncultured Legionella sp.]